MTKRHFHTALLMVISLPLFGNSTTPPTPGTPLHTTELRPSISFKDIALSKGTPVNDTFKLPYKAEASEAPITEQPDGECENYVRSSFSYWGFFGNVFTITDRGSIAKIVRADDNTVYYYNPYGMQAVKSWLKGTIDDNGIMTFPLPQPMMTVGQTEYFANTAELTEEGFGLTEVQEYQLCYDGENVVAVDPEMILILTTWADADHTSLGWTGYGDKEPLCVPMNEVATTPPASLASDQWGIIAGKKIGNVNVAIDNNDMWIQGFSTDLPEAWAKANIDDDRISIPSAQYMGPNYFTGHYEYLQACSIDSVLNPEFEIWEENFPVIERMEMTYNREKLLACALAKNNILFSTTAGPDENGVYAYASVLREPIIKKQHRVETTPPMAPTIVEYDEFYEDYGYGSVTFTFPPYDVDYNIIDTDNLYYELWVNGKPFTFYPDEYPYIDEEMELVPYDFTDYYWFETSGLNRTVYFFFDGASSMGLKTVYKNDNFTVYSDYVSVFGTVSVNQTEVVPQVVSEEYYDINGRQLRSKPNGLFITKRTMSDGSITTLKTVATN